MYTMARLQLDPQKSGRRLLLCSEQPQRSTEPPRKVWKFFLGGGNLYPASMSRFLVLPPNPLNFLCKRSKLLWQSVCS
jgi:hypothetical protein